MIKHMLQMLLLIIPVMLSVLSTGYAEIKNVCINTPDYDVLIELDYKGEKKVLLIKAMGPNQEGMHVGSVLEVNGYPSRPVSLEIPKLELFKNHIDIILFLTNYCAIEYEDYENCREDLKPKIGGYLKIDIYKFLSYSTTTIFDVDITTEIQFYARLFSANDRKLLWEKNFTKSIVYAEARIPSKKNFKAAIEKCLKLIMIDFAKEIGSEKFRSFVTDIPDDSLVEAEELFKQHKERILTASQRDTDKKNREMKPKKKRKKNETKKRKDFMKSRRGRR